MHYSVVWWNTHVVQSMLECDFEGIDVYAGEVVNNGGARLPSLG